MRELAVGRMRCSEAMHVSTKVLLVLVCGTESVAPVGVSGVACPMLRRLSKEGVGSLHG